MTMKATVTLSLGSGFKVPLEQLFPDAELIAKARALGYTVTGRIPAEDVDDVAADLDRYERLKAQLQA